MFIELLILVVIYDVDHEAPFFKARSFTLTKGF